tara:strand:- start:387 stop:611 length:225 start_codon:yes stop_codon:yes gene_type:complete
MELQEILVFILDKGGIAGLALVILWFQRKDSREAMDAKDEIIKDQANDSKEERKATFELMGSLKTLMESINKKL